MADGFVGYCSKCNIGHDFLKVNPHGQFSTYDRCLVGIYIRYELIETRFSLNRNFVVKDDVLTEAQRNHVWAAALLTNQLP